MDDALERTLGDLRIRGHRAVVMGAVGADERIVGVCSAAGERADASSMFEIGSVSKAFTGTLLADMHLRREVSLGDPLSRHLPGTQPTWRHREPTLLELATHRTGLPNTPGPLRHRELAYALGVRRRDPWADVSEEQYRRLVAQESPKQPSGRRVRYSSMAFGLLGDALGARAGVGYEQLLSERVLTPLGMRATGIVVRPPSAPHLLVGHSPRGRPRPPLQDFMPAAGGLRSNADDMLRFLAACLDPSAEPPGPAIALAQRSHARIGRRAELGLGWIVAQPPGQARAVWHNGGTWGFRSFAGFAPERRAAVVVMSNTARSVDRLGFRVLERLAGA